MFNYFSDTELAPFPAQRFPEQCAKCRSVQMKLNLLRLSEIKFGTNLQCKCAFYRYCIIFIHRIPILATSIVKRWWPALQTPSAEVHQPNLRVQRSRLYLRRTTLKWKLRSRWKLPKLRYSNLNHYVHSLCVRLYDLMRLVSACKLKERRIDFPDEAFPHQFSRALCLVRKFVASIYIH